jgi:hypothetical protein
MPSTADISLYMLLDLSLLVSVPYSTRHSVPSLPLPHQYTASNAMKAVKTKEERINVVTKRPSTQVIQLIYMTTMLSVSTRTVMYAITAMTH